MKRYGVGSTSSLARRGLCLIPEGRGVFPNLTVRENLWVMTHSGSGRRHVERCAFERFPRLRDRGDQPAGTLSGGEQQMLALARAVATSPRLLMLDELSMGLAPLVVDELYNHVVQLAAEGITVVVVEQFARTALSVATLGHGDGERTDRPDGSGTATWSRCSTLPIWDPFNPHRWLHPHTTGRRIPPTPVRKALRKARLSGNAIAPVLSGPPRIAACP